MQAKPRFLTILEAITLVLLAVATAMVFFYAPTEATQGPVQRIFYFHVAAGWVGMLSFGVAAIAGITYLITKRHNWDIVGLSAVEVGVAFIFINIITGSIWARPIWNTWWTWDPRLTTATVMQLIYLAYLMLRQGIEDPDRRARFGAVYTILGFASVPLTYFSARLMRTIHPIVFGSGDPSAEGSFPMTSPMLQTLIFSIITFSFIFITLLWNRIRLGRFSNHIEQLKLKTMS
ncbi:MAG: cytochrome c biogenesis protein CcsA [Anaerolineales bacterium]|nr:cytochrome c biogenesis protein CcsA [Anaerolineales bacterium]